MMRSFACLFALLISVSAFSQNSPAASAAAAPAVTSAASPEVQSFQKIEDSWSTAINGRDQYALELVLSPLFVDVSAGGDISTRNQQVASLITTDDKTMHLDQKVITVRMLGDIAVANGTYVFHHKLPAGQVDEKGVFTHVYERVHGNWLCINSQRTAVRADAPGKGKKQSAADQPFHIPLFTK